MDRNGGNNVATIGEAKRQVETVTLFHLTLQSHQHDMQTSWLECDCLTRRDDDITSWPHSTHTVGASFCVMNLWHSCQISLDAGESDGNVASIMNDHIRCSGPVHADRRSRPRPFDYDIFLVTPSK